MDPTRSGYDPIIVQPVPLEVTAGTTYDVVVVLDEEPTGTLNDRVELLVSDPDWAGEAELTYDSAALFLSQPVVSGQQAYIFAKIRAPGNSGGKSARLEARGRNNQKPITRRVRFR